jgi:uncharacterized protein YdcH (DUF465 family)
MDRNTQEEIKAHLMETNEHFRELVAAHQEYDRQAAELDSKSSLTAEEEVEEHRLKKLKLHLKDEIEQMIHDAALQPA